MKYSNQLHLNTLTITNTETNETRNYSFDTSEVASVVGHHFYINNGYAATKICGVKTCLHELVFGIDTDKNSVINHIDGNILNNRLNNLELTTNALNVLARSCNNGFPAGIQFHAASNSLLLHFRLPGKGRAHFHSSNQTGLLNLATLIYPAAALATEAEFSRLHDRQGHMIVPFQHALKIVSCLFADQPKKRQILWSSHALRVITEHRQNQMEWLAKSKSIEAVEKIEERLSNPNLPDTIEFFTHYSQLN
jgi:hypothetical protein